MNSTNKKSVCIEGDRAMFSSKGAVERFKRDLRVNDQEKLKAEDYFREGWTYQVVSSNENEIKVKLVNVQDIAQQARVLDCDERRKMLKDKLKQMREQKQSPAKIKLAMKNKVPEDILNAYLNLKKYNVNVAIPRPDEVLEKQNEYRNVIHTMIQSFGHVNGGNNNPVIAYFKLLAKHLGLPTTFVPQQNSSQLKQSGNNQNQVISQPISQTTSQQNVAATNNFIEELRKQRDNSITQDVDDEMKKIYESLGVDVNEESKPTTEDQVMDDEMKKIYESLGIKLDE